MSDVSYLKGTITSIKHGFFKRHGGVSTDQFKSLNATARVGDSEDHTRENRRRICEAMGFDDARLVFLDYLPHGDESVVVSKENAGEILDGKDAIMTTEKNLPIAIAVADCNPILLTDNSSFIALIHSGWRGTKANIVAKTVDLITQEYGVQPGNIKAIIGPSIAPQDYPVQMEVSQHFSDKYLQKQQDGHFNLDLWAAVEDQLHEAGVCEVENLRVNTYKNPDFYSYREDSGDTGRFMAIAQL